MKKIFYIYLFTIISLIIPANAQSLNNAEKLAGDNGDIYMSPVWSPDGSMIAFTGAGYKGIWVINLKDKSIQQITDEDAAGFKMKWSPDSKAILSRVARYEGVRRYNAVKVFNVQTGESIALTDFRTMMPGLPQWADAGSKVFMYGRGQSEIFDSGINIDAVNTQLSQKIVYLKDDKIAVEDISSEKINIYEPVKNEKVLNLVTSHDNQKVAFEIVGGNMYVMNIDGSNLKDLGKGYRPSWFPDNKHIAYMISEDDGHQILSSDIYSININGTEKTNLTNTTDLLEMNPDCSPDGKKITYDILNEGAIYIMEINN